MIHRLQLGPLRERSFRFLFLGRTTSFIGNAFANVALAFAVLDLTGSKADLGFVLAARSLPQVLFLLVGGIWADRLPRHRVMVVSNVVERPQPGRDRRPPPDRPGRGLAADGARRDQRTELGVLLPGRDSESSRRRSRRGCSSRRTRSSASARTRAGSAEPRSAASWSRRRAPASGSRSTPRRSSSRPLLLAMIRLPTTLRMEASNFFAELAEGWREFSSRTWLWVIVLQFGFVQRDDARASRASSGPRSRRSTSAAPQRGG